MLPLLSPGLSVDRIHCLQDNLLSFHFVVGIVSLHICIINIFDLGYFLAMYFTLGGDCYFNVLILCILKKLLLILSGLAYKLRSGTLWSRWHSGVQNDENASRPSTAQSYEPHAGHEGTYLCLASSTSLSYYLTIHHYTIRLTQTQQIHYNKICKRRTSTQYLHHLKTSWYQISLFKRNQFIGINGLLIISKSFWSLRWHPWMA